MAMAQMKTVLVVAAHPDDEVLGCGGTIARHVAEGSAAHVLFLADGVSSRLGGGGKDELARRNAAASNAAKVLGLHPPRLFGGPDNALDGMPLIEIIRGIEAVIAEIKPDVVYTHHAGDLNVDHRIACQAVLTACRPQPGFCVRAIYAFEVPSSTEWAASSTGPSFTPQRFVDVTATLDKKRQALAAYQEEMRPFPHARSAEAVDALMRYRGASVGVAAAEAFVVLREIA